MRWTLLAALVFGVRRNPALLNAAARQAGSRAVEDPVLADDDEPDATVHHLKAAAPPAAKPARATEPQEAPTLVEELNAVEGDVQEAMDGVVEQMLAPAVVDAALKEKVETVEEKEEDKAESEGEAKHGYEYALLASIIYLMSLSVSLVVYWVLFLAYFLIAGFVWAFLCMGRTRAGPMRSKQDFVGDFQPVGLCAWMTAPMTVMLESVCCPHFLWAETASKLGVVDFAPALVLVFVLMCLVPVPYALGFVLLGLPVRAAARTYLRRNYKQAGSSRVFDCCQDVLVHSFCCCCAIYQEAAFVEQHQQVFAV